MTGTTAMIDVLIGVMIVYGSLSMFSSGLCEYFSLFLQWRTTILQEGLRTLFGGDHPSADAMLRRFNEHGLIRTKVRPDQAAPANRWRFFPLRWLNRTAIGNSLPKTLSAGDFRDILVDLIRRPAGTASAPPPAGGTPGPIQPQPAATAPGTSAAPLASFNELLQSFQRHTDGPLKDALLAMAATSGGDLDALLKRIELWFQDTMERSSNWYKRRTWWTSFLAATGLCVGLNADTLDIARALYRDSHRSDVVAAARDLIANPPTVLRKALDRPGATAPGAVVNPPDPVAEAKKAAEALVSAQNAANVAEKEFHDADADVKKIKESADQIEAIFHLQDAEAKQLRTAADALPPMPPEKKAEATKKADGAQTKAQSTEGTLTVLGENLKAAQDTLNGKRTALETAQKNLGLAREAATQAALKAKGVGDESLERLAALHDLTLGFSTEEWRADPIHKGIGTLLTILAVSMGAPFWNSVLNKLVNVRGTAPPPTTPTGDGKSDAH